MAQGQAKPKLIVHVGMGKTGTTSIQEMLRLRREALNAKGVCYLGLMFELAPVMRYEWQSRRYAASPFDGAAKIVDRVAEMQSILEESLERMADLGCTVAVWSNEAFFSHAEHLAPMLKKLDSAGVDVQIVVFVRRHDEWAKSAYMQWGIKHKTYSGPILGFADYVRLRPVRYGETLSAWAAVFPDKFTIRNFDATRDVVGSFLDVVGVSAEVPNLRVNEAPSEEELLLRAIYNNLVKDQALPDECSRSLQLGGLDFTRTAEEWLQSLMPTCDELRQVLVDATDDAEIVDAMLKRAGQPVLADNSNPPAKIELNRDILQFVSLQIVINQARQIRNLRSELRKLSDSIQTKG